MAKKANLEKIITRTPFRGSFVSLVEPSLPQGETDPKKARYQITIVLPKDDPFWQQVVGQIKLAATAEWGKIPANFTTPVKDGDNIVDDDGEPKYPEFIGCRTLQVSSTRKPDIAGPNLEPILNADELYSGAWYRVACRAFAWNHPTGGKGVSFSLETVQKVKDDEPLGSGGGKASEDFKDFGSGDGAAGAGEGAADDLLG